MNYSEQGLPEEERYYPTGGWFVITKSWHKNGQISSENIGYDGKRFRESKMYSADGKLESREYRKTQNGIIKEIIDYYDSHGKVDKYTEKYGGDPIFETTYNTSGNVLIRKIYMVAEGRAKEEQFNDRG